MIIYPKLKEDYVETVTPQEFIAFAKTKEGQELQTRVGKSKFIVRVVGNEVEYTPLSTNKPRPHELKMLERVLEHFHRTGSYTTTEYRFTMNASYTLTLISLLLAKRAAPAVA